MLRAAAEADALFCTPHNTPTCSELLTNCTGDSCEALKLTLVCSATELLVKGAINAFRKFPINKSSGPNQFLPISYIKIIQNLFFWRCLKLTFIKKAAAVRFSISARNVRTRIRQFFHSTYFLFDKVSKIEWC